MSDEPIPGLVEVLLEDADGKVWRFIDTAPMFGDAFSLLRDPVYPVDFEIECTVPARRIHDGRPVSIAGGLKGSRAWRDPALTVVRQILRSKDKVVTPLGLAVTFSIPGEHFRPDFAGLRDVLMWQVACPPAT